MKKRLLALVALMCIYILVYAANATDGINGNMGPAFLDYNTSQLYDSQDPPHYISTPHGGILTLTGHGTVTLPTSAIVTDTDLGYMIAVSGGLVLKTDTSTNTYASAYIKDHPTISFTSTETASATVTITNVLYAGPGLSLSESTSTVTQTTLGISYNPKVNLEASVAVGAGLYVTTGTATATATSGALSNTVTIQRVPPVVVLPNSTKTLSGTQTITQTDLASATPAAGQIPIADGNGYLDGWIGIPFRVESPLYLQTGTSTATATSAVLSNTVTLRMKPTVLVLPYSTKTLTGTQTITQTDLATGIPTESKIPIASASGTLDSWIGIPIQVGSGMTLKTGTSTTTATSAILSNTVTIQAPGYVPTSRTISLAGGLVGKTSTAASTSTSVTLGSDFTLSNTSTFPYVLSMPNRAITMTNTAVVVVTTDIGTQTPTADSIPIAAHDPNTLLNNWITFQSSRVNQSSDIQSLNYEYCTVTPFAWYGIGPSATAMLASAGTVSVNASISLKVTSISGEATGPLVCEMRIIRAGSPVTIVSNVAMSSIVGQLGYVNLSATGAYYDSSPSQFGTVYGTQVRATEDTKCCYGLTEAPHGAITIVTSYRSH